MNSNKTAILLFVYNRPKHTRKVLEGLQESNINKLIVFSDGARSNNDQAEVNEVRELFKNIAWCDIDLRSSESNKGLARSIIEGVTEIFDNGYERVIVLEDDCVPKPDFFEYMHKSLDFYEANEKVMHISGFGLPLKKHTNPDNYFTPYPCSWGWGTWKKYWLDCNFDQNEAYKKLLQNNDEVKRFNTAGEAFSEFLTMQMQGKVNSWLIRWYFYIYQNDGRCAWAYDSFINNKGFDGTGEHSNTIDRFNQKNKLKKNINNFKFENNLIFNKNLIREFRRHFMGKRKIEKIKTTIYLTTGLILGK